MENIEFKTEELMSKHETDFEIFSLKYILFFPPKHILLLIWNPKPLFGFKNKFSGNCWEELSGGFSLRVFKWSPPLKKEL